MKNPCSKNCERRSVTCHAECEEYLAFYNHNRRADKARVEYQQAGNFLKDYMLKQARKNNRVGRVHEI